MYIDGNLKGGFQTVKAYAEFCAKFKSWMEEKSLKLWPPRMGEILAQDYRHALDYVNKSVCIILNRLLQYTGVPTCMQILCKAKGHVLCLCEIQQ